MRTELVFLIIGIILGSSMSFFAQIVQDIVVIEPDAKSINELLEGKQISTSYTQADSFVKSIPTQVVFSDVKIIGEYSKYSEFGEKKNVCWELIMDYNGHSYSSTVFPYVIPKCFEFNNSETQSEIKDAIASKIQEKLPGLQDALLIAVGGKKEPLVVKDYSGITNDIYSISENIWVDSK